MRLSEAVRVAWEALRANKLRSSLTMLGVVIGVTSVVLLVAIGSGARNEVTLGIESLGSNILFVAPGDFSFGSAPSLSRLTLDDVRRVGDAVGDPRRVAATIASGELARVGPRRTQVNLNGTNETIPFVFDRTVARGSFFSETDVVTRRRVAVLGADPVERLFPDRDPLGRFVTIAGVRFRVIGVLSRVGTTLGVDRNQEAFIPVTAAQRLFGVNRVDGIAVKAASPQDIPAEQQVIRDVVSRAHPDQDFQVLTQDDILGVVGRVLSILTIVLASIAGISLLVGGVGVMNIMLVSVSERTREIGLRKAVGARTRDVLRQFLLEAVALTVSGGAIGILLGIAVALVVGRLSPVPAAITGWSVVLAFGVSVAVGVFFGVYPARKAARMQPIAALRYE
ncbi:MAG TPA: ABC transporter permease [Actinomycetes bacterium]|jgi:putative ABC transport system permease protein|nr:ABC transporter permease [Actinomycetes bacterium]